MASSQKASALAPRFVQKRKPTRSSQQLHEGLSQGSLNKDVENKHTPAPSLPSLPKFVSEEEAEVATLTTSGTRSIVLE